MPALFSGLLLVACGSEGCIYPQIGRYWATFKHPSINDTCEPKRLRSRGRAGRRARRGRWMCTSSPTAARRSLSLSRSRSLSLRIYIYSFIYIRVYTHRDTQTQTQTQTQTHMHIRAAVCVIVCVNMPCTYIFVHLK
jgi:hypothetical protein